MLSIFKKLFAPPVNFKEVIAKGALILDVRTKAEFDSGHIKGSLNIPLDELPKKLGELHQKHKPIIVVCRSGNRSSIAKSILKSDGIEVYNGGAWNSLEQKIK
ncbi:rhodanese-like domain-containing protein [Sediminibacterium sp. KACHI17]|jgi:rhodanese-related sulfurtransferase|uniref:Rhodanese-like domain-containing protein n=1 Tax=Sediminibacterium sp. KACHI17 TaxID=1751071 RepID=A0AAT9GK48_9BACT